MLVRLRHSFSLKIRTYYPEKILCLYFYLCAGKPELCFMRMWTSDSLRHKAPKIRVESRARFVLSLLILNYFSFCEFFEHDSCACFFFFRWVREFLRFRRRADHSIREDLIQSIEGGDPESFGKSRIVKHQF